MDNLFVANQDFSTVPSSIACGQVINIANNCASVAGLYKSKPGDFCYLESSSGLNLGRISEIKGKTAQVDILDNPKDLKTGSRVLNYHQGSQLKVSRSLVGRVLNSNGSIINLESESDQKTFVDLQAAPPHCLERKSINKSFITGNNIIDGLCTLGIGQRVGLFAPAGTGKSTLLGQIASQSQADVNVIALIGERGREVQEFIQDSLGEAGLKKSVIIVATADETALARENAALLATAIAERYRNQGLNVLFLFDSLTRYARAVRDLGLLNGELPVREGYPPSVYAKLPVLLERAGNNSKGSITAIYTVLTQHEHTQDALREEIIGLLDGHIVLDPKLAQQQLYPAINIEKSISRCMNKLHDKDYLNSVSKIKKTINTLQDEELLMFGGEASEELAAALKIKPDLFKLLYQGRNKGVKSKELKEQIQTIAKKTDQVKDS